MNQNKHSEAATADHATHSDERREAGRLRTAVKAGCYPQNPSSPFGPDPVMPDPTAA